MGCTNPGCPNHACPDNKIPGCGSAQPLSPQELAQIVVSHWSTREAQEIAYAVACAESNKNPSACGWIYPPPAERCECSVGLWQIFWTCHPTYDIYQLLDPNYNAAAASTISEDGEYWGQWTTYTGGAYLDYLQEARNALDNLQPPLPKPTNLSVAPLTCQSDQRVTATFHWQGSEGADGYWVDLSLYNNGFQEGTYIGQHVGNVTQAVWVGLQANKIHYWRVAAYKNAPGGIIWADSGTSLFTTPICHLPPPQRFAASGLRTVNFQTRKGIIIVNIAWIRGGPDAIGQRLDLVMYPLGFDQSIPYPLAVSKSSTPIAGLIPTGGYIWRIVTQFPGGEELISQQGTFIAPDVNVEPPIIPPYIPEEDNTKLYAFLGAGIFATAMVAMSGKRKKIIKKKVIKK